MPVDWDKFDNDLNSIIDNAATATDEKLASRVSSLTRMTDEEVQELFPEPADVKRLAQLMKVVKSSEDRNTKVNNIIANTQEFSGVILTLLSKFV